MFSDSLSPADSYTERAAAIPFASLMVKLQDRSGLVVLGGVSGSDTFWPTGNQGLISLRHDGLQATAGLREDLLDTRYRLLGSQDDSSPSALAPWRHASPPAFEIIRTWQDAEGLMHSLSANGELRCAATQEYSLPLAELMLEPCTMTLDWHDGSTTHATLWREPESYRLWAAEERPWPGGPKIRWEVARQWW